MIDLIYFLLIGMAAGWLAGKLMEGHSFGLLGNLVVGVVGANSGRVFVPPRRTSDHRSARESDPLPQSGQSCCCSCCRSSASDPDLSGGQAGEGITMGGKGGQAAANRRPSSPTCGRRWKRTGSWRRSARRRSEVAAECEDRRGRGVRSIAFRLTGEPDGFR